MSTAELPEPASLQEARSHDPQTQAPQTSATGPLGGRAIANAALIVMLFFVLSRVTGLAREIIIGAQFGTSAALDAYLAAFRVPDILFQLVAGGALGSAFIPVFSDYWAKADKPGAWLLFSRVLNLMTLLLVILAALAALFALPLVRYVIAPGFGPEQQLLTANLMRWMLLSTVVFGASGLIMGALNALQHFLLPAAAPVFYNLAIILGAWLLAPRIGVYGLVIGVVVGAFAHLLIQLPALWQKHAIYRLDFNTRDPGVRQVARLMGPRVLGLCFVQLHFLVNTILASGLVVGSLSALNYAWLLMLLPLGIFAQAIGTAAFPTFAAQVSAGQTDAMRATFAQILRMVFFLTIPAAAGLYMLRTPFIQVLLERGVFDAQSTAMVAYALQFYALGLVAHAAVEIMVRAFYALHDTKTPVTIGIAAMVLNVLLSLWWVKGLSYGGLALANTTATTLEMVGLLWLLHWRMEGIEARRLLITVGRSLIGTAILVAALWLWLGWLANGSGLQPVLVPWVASIGGVVIATALYLGVALLLRSDEIRPLWQMLRTRNRSLR